MSNKDTEITKTYASLTKHPEGSLRELFTIAIPLMLSSFSAMSMIFVDRLILARYSLAAMNAAVAAGLVGVVFIFATTGIASIAEVFVGRYNGAKKFHRVGEPVWQMIWFSLLAMLLFLPLGLFGGKLLLSPLHFEDYGLPYFQWLMFFGCMYPLLAALSSFYVGLGKVKLVMISAIGSNILNAVLDILLIFGVKGIIPEMGTKGAAIATGIAQVVQVLVLFCIFMNAKHREGYGTGHCRFNWNMFLHCVKIGYPNAIGHMIEFAAWAFLVRLMAMAGEIYLTVFTVGQSFLILFSFGTEGLQKGVITIAANFIGAGKWKMLSKLFLSAIKFLVIILAMLSIPFIVFPDEIVKAFISEDLGPNTRDHLLSLTRVTCLGVWLYFLFDGLTWTLAGILTAGADTLFIMVMNAVAAWLFAIIPIYFVILVGHGSPASSWMLMNVYASLNAICFFLRYRSQRWRQRSEKLALQV